jgi:hypothetical protein
MADERERESEIIVMDNNIHNVGHLISTSILATQNNQSINMSLFPFF